MKVKIIAILSGIFLLSCNTGQKPEAPALKGNLQVPAVAIQETFETQWKNLVEAAKKEVKVSVIGSVRGNIPRQKLAQTFKERYGVEVDVIIMDGNEATARINTERRAGLYSWDIYLGSASQTTMVLKPAGALDPLDSVFMLPELVNSELIKKTWREGKLPWLDSDRMALGVCQGVSPTYAVNTELVKPEEIKSWLDLLDPKWNGKIALHDPTRAGAGNMWADMMGWKFMGWDYLRALAKTNLRITPDYRIQLEWLTKGKYPIAIAPQSAIFPEFRQAGAPIAYGQPPKEGNYMSVGLGSISLMNKAPHPKAAKLFINWLLSKEGSELLARLVDKPSTRLDASTEGLPSSVIPLPDVNYILSDGEEYYRIKPELDKKVIEIFGPLLER